MEPSGRWQRFIPTAADTGAGSSAMTAESHYTECCERFLDLVGEAAELLHAKANNYLDSNLARTASSLIDVSYQLRKEVLVDKATAVLASGGAPHSLLSRRAY